MGLEVDVALDQCKEHLPAARASPVTQTYALAYLNLFDNRSR